MSSFFDFSNTDESSLMLISPVVIFFDNGFVTLGDFAYENSFGAIILAGDTLLLFAVFCLY